MNTRPSRYRSTLIAAAVAIGCFGAAAAQAHDHGWRDHDRGWRARDHDGDRGRGPRYGEVAPGWRRGWSVPAIAWAAAPLVAYGPGGASVVVRLPF
jgi:hypothetical protein